MADLIRTTFLPFALPEFDEAEFAAIQEVLESGWVTTGPKTMEFEQRFAAAVDAKHAVALNSCTAAMHLALEAVGVQRGDEVITTPYTFAATAEVIRYFDARPVFVDIDSRSLNINPEFVESSITRKTKAIIPVHIGGLPADLDGILSVARKHGLIVIEDAAHAFPTLYKGRPVGSIGDITCFSFYATKTITTGEGGMLCTNNEQWADRVRIMSLHGISRDAWKRYTAEGSSFYQIIAPGYKYNMTDVAAAMGVAQLGKADRMRERRAEIAALYDRAFGLLEQLETPTDCSDCQHAWHLYMLRLRLDALRIDREGFLDELRRQNIGASVHFIPLHIHPYYREQYGYSPKDFPVAHTEYMREISLPIYSRMSNDDVQDVIDVVTSIVQEFKA